MLFKFWPDCRAQPPYKAGVSRDKQTPTVSFAGCDQFTGDSKFPNLAKHIEDDLLPIIIDRKTGNIRNLRDILVKASRAGNGLDSPLGNTRSGGNIRVAFGPFAPELPADQSMTGPTERIIFIVASRGAVTAFLIAKKLHELGITTPIHIVAAEPVPGTPTSLIPYQDLSACTNIKTVTYKLAATGGLAVQAELYYPSLDRKAGNATVGSWLCSLPRYIFMGINAVICNNFFRQQLPKLPLSTRVKVLVLPHATHMGMKKYPEGTLPMPTDIQKLRGDLSRSALRALALRKQEHHKGLAEAEDAEHCRIRIAFKTFCRDLTIRIRPTGRLKALIQVVTIEADQDNANIPEGMELLSQACLYAGVAVCQKYTALLQENETLIQLRNAEVNT